MEAVGVQESEQRYARSPEFEARKHYNITFPLSWPKQVTVSAQIQGAKSLCLFFFLTAKLLCKEHEHK